jgi:mono/diheme cytochrome c family protein
MRFQRFIVAVAVVGCAFHCPASADDAAEVRKVSFAKEVEPLFRSNCQGCHQPAIPHGEYVMTDFAKMLTGGETGDAAIVPGKPEASHLLKQIEKVDGKAAMPKKAEPLSDADIELVKRWIAEGAVDDRPPSAATQYTADIPPTYKRLPVVTAVAFSPDAKWLATSGFHEVFLIDTQTWKLSKRLVGLSERIESLNFSPDSTRLAVTGGSPGRMGEVQVWDVAQGNLLLSRQVTFDDIYGGVFSPDGKLIAFGCADKTVRAIDSTTGEQKLHQGAHEDWIRACVFNPSGTHLLSAGRDMTVKLTEVATERFVDNVTSITPGALRGGINALAIHPARDEFVVGGADGTPKIYRIFRETARVIGDDANLIRKFPAMDGRIFSVSVNKDGSRFAAVSTLDSASMVRVYPYDFAGPVPDDVKAALAKPVAQRSDPEKKLVQDHNSKTSEAIVAMDLPGVNLYAVAFQPMTPMLALAGSDGMVRLLNQDTKAIEASFSPIEIATTASESLVDVTALKSAHGLPAPSAAIPDPAKERELLPADKLLEIEVMPAQIKLTNQRDYAQLVVTAVYASGQRCDVTRLAQFKSTAATTVSALGLLRPKAAGASAVDISFAGQQKTIAIETAFPANEPIDFVRDVNPIISRLGCNAGTCHGAQKGKNGFKLSLRGYDPLEDIRALSDDLCQRRLNTAAADSSLMLLKPVGTVPHEGGVLMSTDSVHYNTLRQWIAEGAKLNLESKKVARIELLPSKPVIELENAWQQFQVIAHYGDGSSRDVTQEAFIESGNAEVCKSFSGGLAQAIRRGEAPVLARYEGSYAAATLTVMGNRDGFAWSEPESFSTIDQLVANKWQRMKIQPSEPCNDAEFLRRVRLDLTGLPPTITELKEFLADSRPARQKRREKIDALIGNPDYVDHWTNKWADLLQVNSKFIGAEGAKAFREWIRTAVAENRPYNKFAHEILTASGSNKDNPAASYYKILRDPDLIMENTTHLFLAVRFNCNKCHDHPFERWTQDQYYELAAFFAQTGLKKDPAGGDATIGGSAVDQARPLYEEIFDKPDGEMTHVRTNKQVAPKFPFECENSGDQAKTRRERLAAWITSPNNNYFARSYVNRLWGYLTGAGLMAPLDDIRAGNPPTNPELLEHLTSEFIRSGFDSEHVIRLICNSRTYQLSVGTTKWNADDNLNYSHATARRLPAEVLYDAVYQVTGSLSDIPGVAPGTRAAALPDVAVQLADGFLNNLGRPVRESACECERSGELQLGPVMALVSGPTVGKAISDPKCALPTLALTEMSEADMIREIYLRVLNRPAEPQEVKQILENAELIVADHAEMERRVTEREAWWVEERAKLEAARLMKLDETKQAATSREQAIAPERQRLEAERVQKIAAAEEALKKVDEAGVGIANKWLSEKASKVSWFPATPLSAKASNGATLVTLPDRSVRASGKADKGTYTLTFRTPLRNIRGLRLEALSDETIKGNGPGLSANGNFVITEIEVTAAPLADEKAVKPVPFASGKADFTQEAFAIEQVFDGQKTNDRGWAVAARGAMTHWAALTTKEPIDYESGALITVVLHQFHDAVDHRLGHFRISFAIDQGEIDLGLPEEFAVAATAAEETRTAESLKPLLAYLRANDKQWLDVQAAVAAAKQPVPADEPLVALRGQITALEVATPDDTKLVQLRTDFEASKQQIGNRRLTLAQDLTWALINSPAFLFNH